MCSLTIAYLLFLFLPEYGFTGNYVLIPLAFYTAFYSLMISASWTIIFVVTPSEILGIGMGVLCSILNLSYVINPTICG